MQLLSRAIIIRWSILRLEDDHWNFEIEAGSLKAHISRDGWRALLRTRTRVPAAMSMNSLIYDREAYLHGCRRQQLGHGLDVWVDGLGKVLSMHCEGSKVDLTNLTRGTWETHYFGLPSPKSRRSPYYVPVEGKNARPRELRANSIEPQ